MALESIQSGIKVGLTLKTGGRGRVTRDQGRKGKGRAWRVNVREERRDRRVMDEEEEGTEGKGRGDSVAKG